MSSIVGVFHSRLLMLLALACVSMLAIPAEAQSLRDVYTVSGVPEIGRASCRERV